MPRVYVINSRGEREPFSERKVYQGAKRAGASRGLANKVAQKIALQVYSGVKTMDIYQEARKMLNQESPAAALRFSLKAAMRALGPTGFPFEKYIGTIFAKFGYAVELGQFVSGECCADYEIDILARKNGQLKIGECKYHNLAGGAVQIEVALSNYARFLDIQGDSFFRNNNRDLKVTSMLITNTRFTSRAIQYSECVGVELLGWNYPRNHGLEYLIDSHKLYPLTILPSLKPYAAELLGKKGLMLAADIANLDVQAFSREIGLPTNQLQRLVQEAQIAISDNL